MPGIVSEMLTNETIKQLIMTAFGVGLVTGFVVYLTTSAVSSALRIFKNI